MKPRKALLIVGHGSRIKGFQIAMERTARALKSETRFYWVECAYLEIASPQIPQAIDSLVKKGAREIFVLPYFLLLGRHTQSDIPSLVKLARQKYLNKIKIFLCPYLGYHECLVSIIKQRLREAHG